MKNLITLILLLTFVDSYTQNASTFFPTNQGHIWRYKMTPLDTLNNPIDSLVAFRVDSFATSALMYGKDAKVLLSKTGDDPFLYEEPYLDTILLNFEGTIGNEYLGMEQLSFIADLIGQFFQDTTGGVLNFFKSFEGWKSYYRFANAVNSQYTILQRDTTFTIDTLTLPLRFQILGRRLNDETIQTELGQFTCKKFTLERRISYLLLLPPPIPPLAVKIVGFLDTLWIAPNNWIVKTFLPSTTVDLTFIGLGSFSVPGMKMDVHNPPLSVNDIEFTSSNFKLYQNYPNPFNPSTVISYQLPVNSQVKLKVYDILGNEVMTLVDEYKEAGNYEVELNVGQTISLSSGVYIYRLTVGEYTASKKMVIIK